MEEMLMFINNVATLVTDQDDSPCWALTDNKSFSYWVEDQLAFINPKRHLLMGRCGNDTMLRIWLLKCIMATFTNCDTISSTQCWCTPYLRWP